MESRERERDGEKKRGTSALASEREGSSSALCQLSTAKVREKRAKKSLVYGGGGMRGSGGSTGYTSKVCSRT